MSEHHGWDETYDVLVVGSGSAALSAALRVSAAGLRCKVLEKSAWIGGTGAMSGAGTWIPANDHARAAGIADNLDEALTYLRSASPDGWISSEDELWRAFANAAPSALKFIELNSPLRFALTQEPDVYPDREGGKLRGRRPLSKWIVGKYARHIRPSTLPHLYTYQEVYDGDLYHRPIWATLRILPQLFLEDCVSQPRAGECARHRATQRLPRPRLRSRDRHACDATASRSGWFHSRPCCTECRRAKALSSHAGRGHCLWRIRVEHGDARRTLPWTARLAGQPSEQRGRRANHVAQVGGALARMDQANVYPTVPTVYEGKPHGLPVIFQAEKHAIVVNSSAKRFVSEYDFNIGVAVDRRDPATGLPANLPAWVIADSRLLSEAPPLRLYSRRSPNWLVRANSIRELASKINIPADALEETVGRYNRFCEQGSDLDFHRGESPWEQFKAGGPGCALGYISRPPFLAAPFNRSILGTKGGARTNQFGQVLRIDGSVIPGLYAAGLAMANPIGTVAVAPGTTIGPNLTWGYICGEALASAGDQHGGAASNASVATA